ncbi:hypothetical protein TRFO_29252 [Tritrichomonas foetus]|uniref:Thioredoxin domain-containing protein n=1 Tax=Tritrichomonas foetus TaxID=1144522 RepID=A0A1J4JY10_9EUKA|nr:hypothetical protein TRFO_29252 [Tritrichomonas foetus]|eukprot:OHT03336.1 hypothetical protein TRFO_29252 [Tritrichomonas foetus]
MVVILFENIYIWQIIKLMLFLFSLFIWWDFNENEFDQLKKESNKKPIFVVCYSHYCPHCSGLPEGTKQFSDGIGNRTDFYVTMLNCADNQGCHHFKLTGTPHMVLVTGTNRKYWPRIYSKNGEDWIKFIDKYVKPSLRRIETDEEYEMARNEPSDGGTTFHLETPFNFPSENNSNSIVKENEDGYKESIHLLSELNDLSMKYVIYNDTFTYRVNKELKKPILYAHTCPKCSVTFKGDGDVSEFIETYKFGSRHRYDMDEYKKTIKKKPLFAVFVEEKLNSAQEYALESLPASYFNQPNKRSKSELPEPTFGWVSLKDSKSAMNVVNRPKSDLPLFVYNFKGCLVIHTGRMIDAAASGFIKASLKGKLCGKVINEKMEVINYEDTANKYGLQPKSEQAIGMMSMKNIVGYKFIFLYTFGLLFLILIIRMKSPIEDKEE